MNWMNLAIVVHVLIAFAIVGLVLLQHGKGADMGSGFGGGASGSLFGATGSANFLSRTTAILAAFFFASSLALAYLATTRPREAGSVVDRAPATQPNAQPQKPEAQKGEAKSEKPQGAPESGAPAPAEKSVPQ
ncbi:MAG TPA: preprotein translocase subunit SecG [Burkholderiales bacterium]|nr:preprotein translocase subunit SecG [Burkholderiales bacterium]